MILDIIRALGPVHSLIAFVLVAGVAFLLLVWVAYFISRAWHKGKLDIENRYGKKNS